MFNMSFARPLTANKRRIPTGPHLYGGAGSWVGRPVVLRIRAQGLSGWGEIRPVNPFVGETAASMFDEILLDDFFFTNCKCESCIAAKGDKSWRQFRVELMRDAAKNLLVEPAKKINPKITFLTAEEVAYFEGCLSVPDFRGRVPRIRRIRLQGFDRDGNSIDREVEGFPAVVYQHEVDHLNGIVFLDRMKDFSTLSYQQEFDRYWAAHAGEVAD